MKRRTVGPSLSRKNVAKTAEGQEEDERGQALDPVDDTLSSVLPVCAVAARRVVRRCSSFVDAGVLRPSPGSCRRPRITDDLDLGRLLGEPAETMRKMTTPSATNAEQDDGRAGGTWDPVTCIFVTSGPATVARIAPSATGIVIVEVMREQPREPDEEEARRRRGTRRAARGRAATSAPRRRARARSRRSGRPSVPRRVSAARTLVGLALREAIEEREFTASALSRSRRMRIAARRGVVDADFTRVTATLSRDA